MTRHHDLPSLRHWCMFAIASVFCLTAIQTASAVPILEVQLQNVPDVLVQAMLVDYDSAGSLLMANGTAVQFDDDGVGPAEPILNGGFSLTSTIDDLGFTSGSLTISGTIPTLGFNSGTLLTGTLTDGGTPPPAGSTDQLHFTFDPTGGDLFPAYSVGTGVGGIIMSSTGFPGDFSMNFDNAIAPGLGSGSADIGVVVPEPASAAFCLLFLTPAFMVVRRRVARVTR